MIIYPPATHPQIIRMHFFITDPPDPRIIRSARGYNRHPRITNVHSTSLVDHGRGLFWVEPVLLNRSMVLATVLQLSFRVLLIFL